MRKIEHFLNSASIEQAEDAVRVTYFKGERRGRKGKEGKRNE